MFFIMELQHTMKLHPSYFGPNIRQFLRQKLIADVEGTCDGQYGYIICVLDDNDLRIPPGKILTGQGSAEFHVHYRAIVWKPFKVGVLRTIASVVLNISKIPVDLFLRTRLSMRLSLSSTRWVSLQMPAPCPCLSRHMSGSLILQSSCPDG